MKGVPSVVRSNCPIATSHQPVLCGIEGVTGQGWSGDSVGARSHEDGCTPVLGGRFSIFGNSNPRYNNEALKQKET